MADEEVSGGAELDAHHGYEEDEEPAFHQEQAGDEHEHDEGPAEGGRSKKQAHGLVLPLATVRRILKTEVDVKQVSAEASFLIAKATELFVEEVAGRSVAFTFTEGRKQVSYKDVAAVQKEWAALDFLADVVPQKVSAAALLANQASSS